MTLKDLRTYLRSVLIIVLAVTLNALGQSSANISAKIAREMLLKDTSIVLLDVRTPGEHREERIANKPLMPLQYVESKIGELEKFKKKKIIVYCRSGNRSDMAVEILREYGFNAFNMEGGIIQWKRERFPTISGPIQ
ncbi:MAG: rhodanese-like domain-containing protein [Bacteroidetes bacterium]|nr:rhodanese-like domain-containing protein [Bacteroidota bacterium]